MDRAILRWQSTPRIYVVRSIGKLSLRSGFYAIYEVKDYILNLRLDPPVWQHHVFRVNPGTIVAGQQLAYHKYGIIQ